MGTVTDADETFGSGTEGYKVDFPTEHNECWDGVDHMLKYITRRLLTNPLGNDGSLGHVEVKSGILRGF